MKKLKSSFVVTKQFNIQRRWPHLPPLPIASSPSCFRFKCLMTTSNLVSSSKISRWICLRLTSLWRYLSENMREDIRQGCRLYSTDTCSLSFIFWFHFSCWLIGKGLEHKCSSFTLSYSSEGSPAL